MAKSTKIQRQFNGRDESWMQFNRRVLEEAEDATNPLLERVKFLAITASNLDEYVEIRQAGLMQRIEDGYQEPGYDGLRPDESLEGLTREIHSFVAAQYACWDKRLLPEMRKQGIRLLDWNELDEEARAFAQNYFQREVDPLLTPISIDPAHPFPRVLNKALCLALLLRPKRRSSGPLVLGVVTVPRALPRFVRLPCAEGQFDYVLLQDLIAQNLAGMYRGYEVQAYTAFRVTRNSNLYFEEEEARSLLETIRVELHNRRKGDAVRLEIEAGAHHEIVERLRTNFELEEDQVFQGEGPVNLSRIMSLYSDVQRPDLKFPPFTPHPLSLSRKAANIFEDLRTRDILLHHPYDSYDPVVNFIELGAQDPNVVSIKQTLYRTSSDSPMFQAITEAAATKEATLVVELMARFDEASNIRWARNMEDAGVQVFHGVVGLKTHCKLALVVRRDEDGVTRRYCHLGTGNYNPVTARFYTDLSLLTSNPEITERVHMVFNYLTAHAEVDDYRPLLVAPLTMAESFLGLIRREAEHARAGRPAHIIAKMNALLEPSVIEALYQASQAGVEVDLIIRGVSILKPGVKGLSDNIRVRSVVGRFLEHSRIFHFANGGNYEIYLGSADWMPRNLFERCEVVFPVRDPAALARIHDEILPAYLADTTKARLQQADGTYVRANKAMKDAPAFSAQEFLMQLAEGKTDISAIPKAASSGPRPAARATKTASNRRSAKKAVAAD
ncbi:polyphosphate kinase 1 [Occallatibacter riparius]|uniref:Polyphosphate kinase n=1 Tax=Occallatibacter riparius TaxID=1002689 RepID=A0A9J7BXM0_9BACT|nr:polyphosphate kinase 1 [Occallatibacter riparius]UWZ86698.1 polyphosphate kinase 1 [Occallatibacter riparius]